MIAERLEAVGGSLQAAGNHYNKAVTALVGRQGLYGKVERFQTLSAKANKTLTTSLKPIATDNDASRVGLMLETEARVEESATLDVEPAADH